MSGMDIKMEINMPNLPKPLQTYFAAANAQDREAFLACFAKEAMVRDEGKARQGRDAIAEWNDWAIRKYNCRYKVLKCDPTETGAGITARVSGNFPGSPIELTYKFTLENGLIRELEIK